MPPVAVPFPTALLPLVPLVPELRTWAPLLACEPPAVLGFGSAGPVNNITRDTAGKNGTMALLMTALLSLTCIVA